MNKNRIFWCAFSLCVFSLVGYAVLAQASVLMTLKRDQINAELEILSLAIADKEGEYYALVRNLDIESAYAAGLVAPIKLSFVRQTDLGVTYRNVDFK